MLIGRMYATFYVAAETDKFEGLATDHQKACRRIDERVDTLPGDVEGKTRNQIYIKKENLYT